MPPDSMNTWTWTSLAVVVELAASTAPTRSPVASKTHTNFGGLQKLGQSVFQKIRVTAYYSNAKSKHAQSILLKKKVNLLITLFFK